MVCLGLEPGAAGWKKQTNPLCHGGIPYIFDCWADPVVHLLLLKSSRTHPIECLSCLIPIGRRGHKFT